MIPKSQQADIEFSNYWRITHEVLNIIYIKKTDIVIHQLIGH